ncbi:hypothetical protein GJ744_006982 [Endocarpon pusillum]|uniref:Uncharacterized protein n=1 Tax=Endocarpon pusillum TaxID=364733 RepID=A0A8H7A3V7_9EURO|nr:hypothetical protein GJ744_006982 [Endocarpon pusillum]
MANFVIRAGKNSTIPANAAGQVAIRLNHSGKADLVFTSKHAEIPNGVISATQRSVLFTNEDSTPREIKRGTILGTATLISAGSFAYLAQATEVLNGFLGQGTLNRPGTLGTSAFAASSARPNEEAEDANVAWLQEAYHPKH